MVRTNQKPEARMTNQFRNQNDRMERDSSFTHWGLILVSGFWFLVSGSLLVGCTGNAQSRQYLDSGKHSLDSGNYDQTIRDADAVINSNDGPALAEAYYLRGYAIE